MSGLIQRSRTSAKALAPSAASALISNAKRRLAQINARGIINAKEFANLAKVALMRNAERKPA